MANIQNYLVLNFSGGVRRDKSFLEMDRTELLDARNVEIDERGRVKTRRGSQQFGQTLTGTIENIATWASGSTMAMLVNNNATTSVTSLFWGKRLTTAITTASTTVVLNSTSNLSANGVIEIEGDLITYGSKNGDGVTLETVTGITSSHAVGAAAHQWVTLAQSGTALDARMGVYYSMLGANLYLTGYGADIKYYDGSTISDVSSEPAVILLQTYRDRIYGAGDSSGGTNSSSIRVSFSARGDGTTWTTAADYFDIFDQRGEPVTALKVLGDRLGIFKYNSIFTYDEIELKHRIDQVGAYNDKVVQQIGPSLITFCPTGIYETNLFSAKQIGEPVREYWENFLPKFDSATGSRVVTNTFAAVVDNKYILFIEDITNPTSTTDVVLVYDLEIKAWTVYTGGFTDFSMLKGFNNARFGDGGASGFIQIPAPFVFGADSNGKIWKFFTNKYRASNATIYGGDIFVDLRSDTGSPVSATIETPFYDMGQPTLFKKPKRLRVYAERGMWSLEYRVENEDQVTQYRPLGVVTKTNQTLDLPKDCAGYRIGFRVSAVNTAAQSIFNGFVFENIEVDQRANK